MFHNHHTLAVLAAERARDRRAEADLVRAARVARGPRRRPWHPRAVRLGSGGSVLVRPIRKTDGPLLLDGFDRLSARSRRLRFLGAKTALTAKDVRYLTDVDHHDHEALVALDLEGRGVAVARYIRAIDNPSLAEVAIVVVDEWQRRGVGRLLLERLAKRADDEGVRCFTGVMAADNVAVVALLYALGARPAMTAVEAGVAGFTVPVRSLLAVPRRADDLVAVTPCPA